MRTILESPDDQLDHQSQLLRQDLLTRYPAYADLRREAHSLHDKLAAMPLVSDNKEGFQRQKQMLEKLGRLSLQEEILLREMAVRREPAAMIFPPLRTTADIQRAVPNGHAVLIFVATSKAIYGFLLGKEQYGLWQIKSPTALARQLASMLREMGNFQQNREISLKELQNVKWKQYSRELLDTILKGRQIKGYAPDFSKKFDELVIVPDGLLWYVPFEALQVKVKGELQPLISRVRIRYAPLASLATAPPGAAHRARGNTAVVVGRLFPHDDDSVARTRIEATERGSAGSGGASSRRCRDPRRSMPPC